MNNQLEDHNIGAKLAFWGTIIAAIISVIGVGISAYLNYLSDTMPLYMTQTAAAEMTQRAQNQTVFPSSTPDTVAKAEIVITATAPSIYNSPSPHLEADQVSKIAFVRFWDKNFKQSSIFLVDSSGGGEKQLTSSNFNSRDPSWSPDGRWVAFSSNKDGDYEIYLMDINFNDLNGDNWIQLTFNSTSDRGPSWSPDGKWIAYYSPHDEKQSEIHIISVNDGSVRQITFNNVFDRYPSWSPDSQNLIYQSLDSSKWSIVITDLNGTLLKKIVSQNQDIWWARWSPNGRYIAYSKGDYSGSASIYIYNVITETDTQLSTKISSSQDWSYNGTQLVFSCWDAKPKIWVSDIDGNNGKQLTFGDYYDTQPVWYP